MVEKKVEAKRAMEREAGVMVEVMAVVERVEKKAVGAMVEAK